MGGKLDRDAIHAAMRRQEESKQLAVRNENAQLAKLWWNSEKLSHSRVRGEKNLLWKNARDELFEVSSLHRTRA